VTFLLISSFCYFLFLGIITVEYCEDELGYIKLIAQPPITNDTSSNEQDVPPTNEQISTEHNSRKSVQLVFEYSLNEKNKHLCLFILIDYVVRKMDVLIIRIV
jgi:hypothetical protein